ncbi:iron(III) transport system substrate-binding protein [Paraburkholderia fungorum]|uniref:Iron(III) transport system substrate-binding protein n=2 Tax=Paraburkholderia fungorum TaxID=134537 RepID=A0AAW3URH2_9BURK|nr:iron(III) transport system substrate-binding protein [Paraburkholderia fungorum]MBB6200190.1 iron(III) transport system substrate-binding protein [Paraburkholderia fungorum]
MFKQTVTAQRSARPLHRARTIALMTTAAIALLAGTSATAVAKTTLLVYTALEDEQLKPYADAFEQANPDIEIKWVRDSTGVITAKILAEKNNPQADAIWGLAATSIAKFESDGMLLPYAPKNLPAMSAAYRDPKSPPNWFGMDVWGATICFNTAAAAEQHLPKPQSWQDLTKPVYKGKIVMADPASSGTGYFDVTAWLQLFGEQGGWQFMDALDKNIAQYNHSGSAPCTMAASGEYPIGISFEYRAATLKAQGAPIDLVFPKEGLGWDLEAFAIMKNTTKLDAAKKLADFASSREANSLYARSYAITAVPGTAKPLPNVPANYASLLVKNDFTWAANNRAKILAQWAQRYSSKSETRQ